MSELYDGIFHGTARWCSKRRGVRQCRTISQDDHYAFVQDTITYAYGRFMLATGVVMFYVGHRLIMKAGRHAWHAIRDATLIPRCV